ncbi:hypothetical protein [Candidatus Erwinia haradaeae]|nr:hypothetical protein [Candidatus Erwinia haradaeae]
MDAKNPDRAMILADFTIRALRIVNIRIQNNIIIINFKNQAQRYY